MISKTQQQEILDFYPDKYTTSRLSQAKQYASNNTIKLIGLTGGLFITLGVISFLTLLISTFNLGLLGQAIFVYPLYLLTAIVPSSALSIPLSTHPMSKTLLFQKA